MHKFRIEKKLERILLKLLKKDKLLYRQIKKKIDEVINIADVEHYKNLKKPLQNFKRAHIGHFVLVFKYDKQKNTILFEDFDHHDKIYSR